jgi:hypothetical protein
VIVWPKKNLGRSRVCENSLRALFLEKVHRSNVIFVYILRVYIEFPDFTPRKDGIVFSIYDAFKITIDNI